MVRSSLLLAFALLATGCQTTRYDLRPPVSDTGRLCVTQCAGNRETCRSNELNRARMDRDNCEHQSERTLRACLAKADSPETRRNCENRKPGCWTNENTERCEGDYRNCFAQCGGIVIKVVE